MPPVLNKVQSPNGPNVSELRRFITDNSAEGRLPAEIAIGGGKYAQYRDLCLAQDIGFAGAEFPIKFNFREPWMNGGEVIISEAPNE